MNRESGDQNGYVASSVACSGCGAMASMGRSQSLLVPSGVVATTAMRPPSGEMIGAPTTC
jgi:hypothetical protein